MQYQQQHPVLILTFEWWHIVSIHCLPTGVVLCRDDTQWASDSIVGAVWIRILKDLRSIPSSLSIVHGKCTAIHVGPITASKASLLTQ